MRLRLLAGATSLADYEILEMLLFLGIPRRDTKPLAKQLILRFGGLRDVLAAPSSVLLSEGVTAQAIAAFRLVTDAGEQLAGAEFHEPVQVGDHAALERYLADTSRPAGCGWSVVLLGSRNQVVGDRACDGADADAVTGRLLREALAQHAVSVILVREVDGRPEITVADRALFKLCRERSSAISVVVLDLVVMGAGGRMVALGGRR